MKSLYIKSVIVLAILISVALPFVISTKAYAAKCGGANTTILECDSNKSELGGIGSLLNLGIKILTGLIATAAVAGVVYGGILYTTAGGNSDQTKKAIGYIRNVVIGLILFVLMYSLLYWLVPGLQESLNLIK